jgi:hypothetical protein
MKKKPARLYPKEDDIIEKIKPYLTKEVIIVGVVAILFLLSIILAIACKSPYNMEFV